jgi:FKBP-type peptidyl-prolyl cis-trans isomerase
MKLKKSAIFVLALGTLAFSSCDKMPGGGGSTTLSSKKDTLSYAIGISIGKNLKTQGLDTLVNQSVLENALKSAMGGKDSLKMNDAQTQQFIQAYFQELQAKKTEGNKKVGEKFLAENKTKEGVKTTASGLQYLVLKEGTGAQPKASDSVTVHYRGTLLSGKEFDSSYQRGEPVTFVLSQVIPGWTEGVQLMKEGAKYKFFIPAELGYGSMGNPSIEPNSTLIFEIELIKVGKSAPAASK